MSFATKKKHPSSSVQKIPPHPQSAIIKTLFDSSAKPFPTPFPKQDPIQSRFDIIETNLSRVMNQHEALLPLISTPPDISALNRQEFAINILKAKLQEEEKNLNNLEIELKNFQSSVETTITNAAATRNEKSVEIVNLEKGVKGTNNLINGFQSNLKDVESTVLNFQRLIDNNFKDLSQRIFEKVEGKMQGNEQDAKKIMADFENYIKKTLKNKLDSVAEDMPLQENSESKKPKFDKGKIKEDINNIISAKMEHYIDNLRLKYERDINNLHRDLGTLRCEMELIQDQRKKADIVQQMQKIPQDADVNEKKIKINNLEQELFIRELDLFNKENTQRIIDDLHFFEQKLLAMKAKNEELTNSNDKEKVINELNSEMQYFELKLNSLKYEIDGSLAILEMNKSPKPQKIMNEEIKIIEGFPEKVKSQMESINQNLDITYKKLRLIEEKLSSERQIIENFKENEENNSNNININK